ncbi:unnamed protein product [Pleuronectes platessa]|uniref:Uncharacterized protein n=1 Tax=Pleuronectes platessa TaxID=8262 RepID=A0A9N7ZD62_PLEPL|nr:unnamed protein product [Pleuronectes platessa]
MAVMAPQVLQLPHPTADSQLATPKKTLLLISTDQVSADNELDSVFRVRHRSAGDISPFCSPASKGRSELCLPHSSSHRPGSGSGRFSFCLITLPPGCTRDLWNAVVPGPYHGPRGRTCPPDLLEKGT